MGNASAGRDRTAAARRATVALVVLVELLLLTAVLVATRRLPGAQPAAGADRGRVDIADVPEPGPEPAALPGAATGTYTWNCGHNAEGHRNSANVVASPGKVPPQLHAHEYVGNLSTDDDSTDASLAAARTTCDNGDQSTYFWPVLLVRGAGMDGHGQVRTPASVVLTFLGNPVAPVVAMPRFLRAAVGNARALTEPMLATSPTWTCSSTPRRRTDGYPRCPAGDQVLRVFEFPSCWDGRRLDSPDHRAHLVAPGPGGACPHATFPVPRLRMTVAYDVPAGADFVVDAFPDQNYDSRTDHAFFISIVPDRVMAQVVRCLNSGRTCSSET
ncbi:DUF1996 domain-containing protein [Actinoplanes subtropicus]|uniref:DUF1996 domain-containing protein n=1 Tax=Actinoplanes subtropicus TaxID=543632 RepID=UPI0007C4FDE3|nr:DUF1996 domain-containing protein [Actinoplanes subtropicus]